jgi:hypothetical protein
MASRTEEGQSVEPSTRTWEPRILEDTALIRQQPRLYLEAAHRGTERSPTFVNYAVLEWAERFTRAFDNVDYLLERVGLAEKEG